MATTKQATTTKPATKPATSGSVQPMRAKRPAGTNAPPCTPDDVAKAQALGHWQADVMLACGTPATLVHVVRRRYAVLLGGKLAGYYTAALAGGNHTNALQRAYSNTAATLRLH